MNRTPTGKSKSILYRSITLLTVLFCLFANSINAQQVTVSAKLDSVQIAIGGQTNLIFEVKQPRDTKVKFPVLADTISKSVEIVSAGKDEIIPQSGNDIIVRKIYRITSFDSGVHLIPTITFEIVNAQAQQFVQTQPISLTVMNPFKDVDPKKGLYDIKEPINTPFLFAELLPYLPYILGFLLVVGAIVIYLVWRFNRKLIIPFINKEKPVDPPHVIALRELGRIKEEKAWQKHQTKRYFSEITDVLRQYIEARFQISAFEQTSDEILLSLKGIDIVSAENHLNLSKLLSIADLVKFAKMEPTADENEVSMIHAVFFVNQTKFEEQKTVDEKKALMVEQEKEL